MQAARQQGGHLRGKKNDNVKKVPELAGACTPIPRPLGEPHFPTGPPLYCAGLLEARDYTGAVTLLEFERKMFIDQKQASGWKDKGGGADSYEWVEGGNIPLTEEEKEADHTRLMWIGYCAFHLGDYRKALDTYQQIIQAGSDDQTLLSYQSCCLMGLGWFQEAEEKANQGPASPLQTRLLFHLAHRLNDENKLMMFHQKLCDTTSDQLSLASIHYLRNHFQEATDIYKRLLLENRDYTALNVYVALCYYKLDYYDVSLEILAAYLQARSARRTPHARTAHSRPAFRTRHVARGTRHAACAHRPPSRRDWGARACTRTRGAWQVHPDPYCGYTSYGRCIPTRRSRSTSRLATSSVSTTARRRRRSWRR